MAREIDMNGWSLMYGLNPRLSKDELEMSPAVSGSIVPKSVVDQLPAQVAQTAVPLSAAAPIVKRGSTMKRIQASNATTSDPADVRLASVKFIRDNDPAFQEQRLGIDRLEKAIDDYGSKPRELDLSPLAALTDAWSKGKSNFAQTYKAPDSSEERAKTMLALEAKLQEAKTGLTKIDRDLLKDFANRGSEKVTIVQGDGAGGRSGADRGAERFIGAWSRDQVAKTAQEALLGAQGAKSALDSGSAVGEQAFKTLLARASGEKGPLSDTDVSMYSGDPSVQARLKRAWSKQVDGRMNEMDKEDMRILIDAYEKRARGQLATRAQHYTRQVAPAFGLHPEEASGYLGVDSGMGLPETKSSGDPDLVGKPAHMDAARWKKLKELERKAAGG